MSVEKTADTQQEQSSTHPEHGHEQLDTIAHEQQERIRDKIERQSEAQGSSEDKESVLAEARELARDAAHSSHEQKSTPSPAERRRGPASKKEQEKKFRSHIKDAQQDMSAGERLFSNIIHVAPIEKASDAASSTIARPNALLSGSIAAFVTITILYFAAKHYGFQLSGFEAIAAFAGGWLIGILYDYISLMVRGRRRQ